MTSEPKETPELEPQDEDRPLDDTGVDEPPAPVVEPDEDWRDKYLRTLAELDNFQKRQERDRTQLRKFALEGVLRDLLPLFDNLELACGAEGDAASIREGVKMALTEARRVLADKGLEKIDALDELFDPRVHEAVGMIPDADRKPQTIVKVEREGYLLHERVLRPSRVHIAVAPPPPPQAQDEDDD